MKKCLFLLVSSFVFWANATAQPAPNAVPFSLDELERRTFDFFWELADPMGQTPDRWPTIQFSSIAATGFGLTAYCIGAERGYVSRAEAAQRALACLRFLINAPQGPSAAGVSGHRGFFYHFLDHKKGLRYRDVELSTIDTTWLIAGILSAAAYFDQKNDVENELRNLADALYRRVEWDWAADADGVVSMGWHPEKATKNERDGFLKAEWRGYNEGMMLYFLALGSPTHPVSEKCWTKWTKPYRWGTFEGQEMINFAPLFGHQWTQMYVDFKGIKDDFCRSHWIDHFENSRRATLADRAYCIRNPFGWADYGPNVWGLTACDGPGREGIFNGKKVQFDGYSARGAALDYVSDDGTITPCAAGGSLPFAPAECLAALRTMWEKYPTDSLVGRYGFKDAFNPSAGWFDSDHLGIDQGAILLQLENYRTGFVWDLLKKSPYVVAGLKKAGFRGGWLDGHERPGDRFSKKEFKGLPYREFLGSDPKQNSKLPLVVFLHGAGERGEDNEAQLKNAVLAFVEPAFQQKWPCHVIAPQCPTEGWWATFLPHRDKKDMAAEPTKSLALVLELIEKLKAEPSVDANRIYIVGLSMGGFGSFEAVARRPDLFAAAMPVCAGAPSELAEKMRAVPMWIFHGEQDDVVPVEGSRAIFEALKKASADVRYTEFATLGHACWQEVFYNEKHLEWLFAQQKK